MTLIQKCKKLHVNNIIQEYLIEYNHLNTEMKLSCYLLLLLVLVSAQDQVNSDRKASKALQVNQKVTDKIQPDIINQNIHQIFINKTDKKYLFIRLIVEQEGQAVLGFYSNANGSIMHSCNNTIDSCYIPSKSLTPDSYYSILIMSNQPISYTLHTYWSDIEQLIPGKDIKFMFSEKDTTQLFFLNLRGQNFEEVRITLKPQTARMEGDNLKMFANIDTVENVNKGKEEYPTRDNFQYESQHVWNDAQVIFISKNDTKNHNAVLLYIQGSAKTIYLMQCQLITKKTHQLILSSDTDTGVKPDTDIYQFIKKQQTRFYKMTFGNSTQVDIYVVRFSVFTGEVQIGIYYDQKMTQYVKQLPYQYMSDIQFHLARDSLKKGTKQMYMKVQSMDVNSTFQLSLQGRKKEQSFQMYQNIFQFVPIEQGSQGMYFYTHIWHQTDLAKKGSRYFDISLIKVQGNSTTLQFYICNSTLHQDLCKKPKDPQFSKYTTKIREIDQTQIGSNIIFTIQVEQKHYRWLNTVEKRALIIVNIVGKDKDGPIFAAVQYTDPNKVRILRDGRALEDRVRTAQAKYYKYINSNPNLAEINIHINTVSGMANIRTQRQDIRKAFLQNRKKYKKDKTQLDTITIKDNLTEPIFIQVFGLVTTIYTLTITPVHRDHPLTNSLVLAQNIEYQIKLRPFTFKIVEIHPIEAEIVFEFSTEGGSAVVCQLDPDDVCKKGTDRFASFGEIYANTLTVREIRFRISNYVDQKYFPKGTNKTQSQSQPQSTAVQPRTIKITMKYRPISAKGNTCTLKKLNQIYSQPVKLGACFQFKLALQNNNNLQVLVKREDIEQSAFYFQLCNKRVKNLKMRNQRYVIMGEEILSSCDQYRSDKFLRLYVQDGRRKGDVGARIMDYSVQYENDIITLADGIAYYSVSKSSQKQVRGFFYQIIDNTQPIQITLINKKGSQQFAGKIVQHSQRYARRVKKQQASIVSTTDGDNDNPYAIVTKEDIANGKCTINCMLVLSVYSKEKPGADVEFGIEVTQNQIVLREGEIRGDFLIQGSIRYYQYRVSNRPTDLMLKISDHNRYCTKTYLSSHPYPSSKNYLTSNQQSTATHKNATKPVYYISVQAVADCPYTISVTEGNSTVSRLEYGQFLDFKLKAGEEFWFYFRHVGDWYWTISAVMKYGRVSLWANSSEIGSDILKDVADGKVKYDEFVAKSMGKNYVTMEKSQKGFCFNCYYIVRLKAEQIAEGSVFLDSLNTKIILTEEKTLYDQIFQEQDSTQAIFYRVGKIQLNVNIFSGQIQVFMQYQDQKSSKTFNSSIRSSTVQFIKKQGHNPIQIRITAKKAPAAYSLQLVPKRQNQTGPIRVNPGENHIVYLENNVPVCFKGMLTQKKNQILITADAEDSVDLALVNIQAKIQGKDADLKKEIYGNIISIVFNIKQIFFTQALNYSICLTIQPSASSPSTSPSTQYQTQLTLQQLDNINLLDSDTELLVRDQGKFAIHELGNVIIDIFQCEGKTQVTFSDDLEELDKQQSGKLEFLGIPGQNHAIRVQVEYVLYLKLKAKKATLLWMPLKEEAERGIGYYKYSIGRLSFSTKFNKIIFKIGGVYKTKQTKTTVQSVKYTLFISNSRQNIQKGVMCEMVDIKQKILSIKKQQSRIGQGSPLQVQIQVQKKLITSMFSSGQQIYFNVIADLTLNPPNPTSSEHQHYRFIYFQQIVQAELLRQNRFQGLDIRLLITLIVVLALAIIAVLCVVVRWFLPILGRLRGRVLVEDAGERDRDGEMDVPPSSDRNQMAQGKDVGTEDKIK